MTQPTNQNDNRNNNDNDRQDAADQTRADEISLEETFDFFSLVPGSLEAFEQDLVYAVHMHVYGY